MNKYSRRGFTYNIHCKYFGKVNIFIIYNLMDVGGLLLEAEELNLINLQNNLPKLVVEQVK